jgi:hypothetical protein
MMQTRGIVAFEMKLPKFKPKKYLKTAMRKGIKYHSG